MTQPFQGPYGRRVLFLSGPVEPPWTRSDKNLVRAVAANLQRYRPRVLTHEGVQAPDHGVETEPAWGPRLAGDTPFGRRIGLFTRLIENADAQLVHLFWPADRLVGTVVRTACKLRNLPVIHTLVRAPRISFGISGALAGNPVVCLSSETEQRLLENGVRNTARVNPGIAVGPMVAAGDKAAIRRKYRIPLDVPVVVYAGDYGHSKAARTVAAAMPRILRQIDCHFVWVCRIRTVDDTREEQLIQEAIAADGFGDCATFLNEVNNLREVLSIATVQVFPADRHHEKMETPLVLLEGMAEGVATVVATKPPLTDIVQAGAAIGIPPNDPLSLAVPVVELLRDPARAAQLGMRGRELVEREFDICKVAAAYEEIYDGVLARHRNRQSGIFGKVG